MQTITAKTPWKDYLGDVPMYLDYFRGTMFEALEKVAAERPQAIAFDFMGKSTTYAAMVKNIRLCARG